MGVNSVVKVHCRRGSKVFRQRQGCPPRGGIRRKPEAKPRLDEQEPHTRLDRSDKLAQHSEIQGCQGAVEYMGRARGGFRSYTGGYPPKVGVDGNAR
ncbi:hypothetical protein [Fervidicola ferrireducens]|uniref:hypothetical protein n=1 Tax=Fervidicola ferrireducens TaxID=520764 RepID=UPI0012EE710D|nr:hypothetical protein [Fervidicola ferrireducens]